MSGRRACSVKCVVEQRNMRHWACHNSRVTIDRTEEPGAHRIVLNFLETLILSGELRAGSQLPSERDLAIELGVSRGTVREAIRMLRAQGLVSSNPGPGRGTRITAGHGGALGKLLKLHVAVSSMSLLDLTETRIALERSAASLACMRGTSTRVEELRRLHHLMVAGTELERFNDLDTEFHIAIAATAEQPFIGELLSSIREALAHPILVAEKAMTDWSLFRARLCDQHGDIVDAIAEGDSESAANAVEQHIRYAYQELDLGERSDV